MEILPRRVFSRSRGEHSLVDIDDPSTTFVFDSEVYAFNPFLNQALALCIRVVMFRNGVTL